MDVDELYDRYLDLCLAGTAPRPAAFLREQPVDPELRQRLEALYEGMSKSSAGTELPYERLGEFRLLRRLDQGGMGTVFIAEQESLQRTVALKIVRDGLRDTEGAVRRFEREALAVARLRHPNLVTLHGAGVEDGVQYLAMEFVPGRSLDDILAHVALGRETLSTERVVRWAVRLARALAYAHEQGIVHRDVKPSNIRITPDDRPLLLDFGVAHDMGPDAQTLTRDFAGSPAYAAPEQIAARGEVDGRTDVYGLGVTLYQCLTGLVPFSGDRIDTLFHRVLSEDPVRPRQLKPAISRDLETIVMKAMAKRRSARYATADEFADDLEAALAYRPIRARRPGPIARLAKWSRRRPATAVAAAALVVLVLLFVAQRWMAVQQRKADARALVAEARATLETYREERRRTADLARAVAKTERELHARYMQIEEDETRRGSSLRLQEQRRRREATAYAALDTLRRAEQLDPAVDGADAVRAELYVERWHEAEQLLDADAERIYRGLVERYDPGGGLVEKFYGSAHLAIASEPPGAVCHLFRYLEQAEVVEGGERRMVAVPTNGAGAPVPPGAIALRVSKGAGDLEEGDLILELFGHGLRNAVFVGVPAEGLEIGDRLVSVGGARVRDLTDLDERDLKGTSVFERAGGPARIERATLPRASLVSARTLAERGHVPARVLMRDAPRDIHLPAGLEVRTTAAPLFLSAATRVGTTPIPSMRLQPGSYVVVVRAPGYVDQRIPLWLRRGDRMDLQARLVERRKRPAGFVHVPEDGDRPGFWIMEREVTAGEYLAFLNDPKTRARIDASDTTILVPRSPESAPGGDWPRGHDGLYALPARIDSDFPAYGLCWNDAQAYIAWRQKRDGLPYRLPGEVEWQHAARGRLEWKYPYGHRFEPKWAKSCFSRRRAWLEPVLSYPVDESPYGVFDMSGSVGEWLDAWWGDPRNGLRSFGGGAWAYAEPRVFSVPGGNGLAPHMAYYMFGFRLALSEIAGPAKRRSASERR